MVTKKQKEKQKQKQRDAEKPTATAKEREAAGYTDEHTDELPPPVYEPASAPRRSTETATQRRSTETPIQTQRRSMESQRSEKLPQSSPRQRAAARAGTPQTPVDDDDEHIPDVVDEVVNNWSISWDAKAACLDVVVGHNVPLPVDNTPVLEFAVDELTSDTCPPLNIVMFCAGSKAEVQPYLALALALIQTKGHRVRIATHPAFADLVARASVHLAGLEGADGKPLTGLLEFYSIGGEAYPLIAYLVPRQGLVPGLDTVARGDLKDKRRMVKKMLMGCYRACFCPNKSTHRQFGADAIISSPTAFAHIHVAEALGIPLIMSFTMPWTSTTAFRHPLIKAKTASSRELVDNYASYVIANTLLWHGLGDVINSFRYGVLGLQPLNLALGPLVLDHLRIPTMYAWSKALVPKPKDWKRNIDVVGPFFMPNLKVKPSENLVTFLESGPAPIYFGFDPSVVKDPEGLTNTIISAAGQCGARAIINAGWADEDSQPITSKSLYIAKDLPWEWLLASGRVAAVCHQGDGGSTAAGLRHGLPTIIVSYYGDQWMWGIAVHEAGAGPRPISHQHLTPDTLAAAITCALTPTVREAAQALGKECHEEDGTSQGVASFHRHLPLLNMRCQVDPSRKALWWSDMHCMRLSGEVAAVLVEARFLNWRAFQPHRPATFEDWRNYTNPLSAVGQAVQHVGKKAVTGTSQVFYAGNRGMGNILMGVPKASFDMISSIQEGLENVPGALGSQTRRRGRVDSFKTGMAEGVKGLGYSVYDGFTGLVTEPVQGGREGGVLGAIGGTARGVVNLTSRVTGGTLGLLVHPTAGAFRAARGHLSKQGVVDTRSVLCSPREAESHAAAARLTYNERQGILRVWGSLAQPDRIEARRWDFVQEAQNRADGRPRALPPGRAPSVHSVRSSLNSANTPAGSFHARNASMPALGESTSLPSGFPSADPTDPSEQRLQATLTRIRARQEARAARRSASTSASASASMSSLPPTAHAGPSTWPDLPAYDPSTHPHSHRTPQLSRDYKALPPSSAADLKRDLLALDLDAPATHTNARAGPARQINTSTHTWSSPASAVPSSAVDLKRDLLALDVLSPGTSTAPARRPVSYPQPAHPPPVPPPPLKADYLALEPTPTPTPTFATHTRAAGPTQSARGGVADSTTPRPGSANLAGPSGVAEGQKRGFWGRRAKDKESDKEATEGKKDKGKGKEKNKEREKKEKKEKEREKKEKEKEKKETERKDKEKKERDKTEKEKKEKEKTQKEKTEREKKEKEKKEKEKKEKEKKNKGEEKKEKEKKDKGKGKEGKGKGKEETKGQDSEMTDKTPGAT